MVKWFEELIIADNTKSSARFLNIMGGIMFAFIYIVDYFIHRVINIHATEILALYYAGVYTTSNIVSWAKGKIETKKGTENV